MAQHKWHKEIKAWADGAEIECKVVNNKLGISTDWFSATTPEWDNSDLFHRIKPQTKEPKYINVYGYLENQNICFQQQIGMPYIGKIKLEVDDD
jgi:hypothetical protein